VSDLTVADFWGIEKSHPECIDNKGYSLILVNSVRGREILEDAKQYLVYFESNRASCVQPSLLHPPTKDNKKVEKFWKRYHNKGFLYIVKKYTSLNIRKQVWRRVRRFVKAK